MRSDLMYYPGAWNQFNSNINLLRVNGIEGAKTFQMTPGTSVALFDSNDDIFYVKNCDNSGFSSIRKFTFQEIKEPTENPTDNFITITELDERLERLKEELKQQNAEFNIQQPRHTNTKSNRNDATNAKPNDY